MNLTPTRSDKRRLPYGWEIREWISKHITSRILPMPGYDCGLMDSFNAAHPNQTSFNAQGAAASSAWWVEWNRVTRKHYPVRVFLHNTLPTTFARLHRRWVKNPYWAIVHRINPRHRYHVMKTGLPPGYYDPDTRLLYAVMNEVQRFVEGTKDSVDWVENTGHEDAWHVFNDAVDWWRRYQDYVRGEEEGKFEYDREVQERLHTEADNHLARIMLRRQYLWYP